MITEKLQRAIFCCQEAIDDAKQAMAEAEAKLLPLREFQHEKDNWPVQKQIQELQGKKLQLLLQQTKLLGKIEGLEFALEAVTEA